MSHKLPGTRCEAGLPTVDFRSSRGNLCDYEYLDPSMNKPAALSFFFSFFFLAGSLEAKFTGADGLGTNKITETLWPRASDQSFPASPTPIQLYIHLVLVHKYGVSVVLVYVISIRCTDTYTSCGQARGPPLMTQMRFLSRRVNSLVYPIR